MEVDDFSLGVQVLHHHNYCLAWCRIEIAAAAQIIFMLKKKIFAQSYKINLCESQLNQENKMPDIVYTS